MIYCEPDTIWKEFITLYAELALFIWALICVVNNILKSWTFLALMITL